MITGNLNAFCSSFSEPEKTGGKWTLQVQSESFTVFPQRTNCDTITVTISTLAKNNEKLRQSVPLRKKGFNNTLDLEGGKCKIPTTEIQFTVKSKLSFRGLPHRRNAPGNWDTTTVDPSTRIRKM
jgi:hypothetical protein